MRRAKALWIETLLFYHHAPFAQLYRGTITIALP